MVAHHDFLLSTVGKAPRVKPGGFVLPGEKDNPLPRGGGLLSRGYLLRAI